MESPKQYTLEELGDAASYRADPFLEKAAKRVAMMAFDRLGRGRLPMGEFRAEVLKGRHAEEVMAYLVRDSLRGPGLHKILALNAAKLFGLEAKFGITLEVEVTKGMVYVRNAGQDAYLETAIRKAGGWRVDGKTLATRLVHAAELPQHLSEWFELRKRQSAGARVAARAKEHLLKTSAGRD